jgi:hypothetical protein
MQSKNSVTVAWLRVAGLCCLAVMLVLDLLTRHKAHFAAHGLEFDTFPWFYPAFGFISTVGLVILAKTLGIMLLREEAYYAR